MAALENLNDVCNKYPELRHWYGILSDLYREKLWHQLTERLEEIIDLPIFEVTVPFLLLRSGNDLLPQDGELIISLYDNFISDFEMKINVLKLSQLAVAVSRRYADRDAAVAYLNGLIRKLTALRDVPTEEARVYLRAQIAYFSLARGDRRECKRTLDHAKSSLDRVTDIDPSVHAIYYWVSCQYHKDLQEFAEFYTTALLYLAYTSVDTLPRSLRQDLASDLALSALLGDDIYNFGELLAHPITRNLLGTNAEWLYHVLHAFNDGDLDRYHELRRVHAAALDAQPSLVACADKLLQKINILCLMEIIFSRPSEDRTIPLAVISRRTHLSVEDVEHLLMKTLSVHLIEGIIDQVDGTVHVSWVQPRVLGMAQIHSLRDRLDNWSEKVNTVLSAILAETPDLVAA